jgi:glycosyltransferase involved in cell wall biosynthesis
MKVALVYDRINKWGGAERLLLGLHSIFPDAPLYTLVYDKSKAAWAKVFPKVYTSFLQHLPFAKSAHEFFPWLAPIAFETFDFRHYDLVITLTSAEAKGIITGPNTIHLCYCLTPTRYLWHDYFLYLKNPGFGSFDPIIRLIIPLFAFQMRQIDQISATKPDHYFAISQEVRKRIIKYYRQNDAEIIYPFVDTNLFNISRYPISVPKENDFFLIVSRFVGYKNIDLPIRVFNKLGKRLFIIGCGNQEKYLRKISNSNITFLGELTDEELVSYYQNCRALIFSGNEDFGLSSLEVQACGKPVVAFAKGGALETVVNNQTGIFFFEKTENGLMRAIEKLERTKFNPDICRRNALRFSLKKFQSKFKEMVLEYEKKFRH